MHHRLLLFDIDGTRIDGAGAGRRALARAFGEVFEVAEVAERLDRLPFAGRTDAKIFAGLAAACGIAPAELESSAAALADAYVQALTQEMQTPDPSRRLLPGVQRLLEHLDGRQDAHLGLLTGNLERGARQKLEPFGLNRFFPGGGFGSDHADRREIARIARQNLTRLTGIPFEPRAVVVIGDTEHDVDCARANGFRAVAVKTGWASPESLESARPDALLHDLSDRKLALEALGLTEPVPERLN